MQTGPTPKHREQVVASLCESAKAVFDTCGPCEITLPKGSLRFTDQGDGGVRLDVLSNRDTPQFSFTIKDGKLSYVPPTSRESIRGSFQSERAFLAKLDSVITTALKGNIVRRLQYPSEADPSIGEIRNRPPAQALSLQEEIAQAWSRVSQILTTLKDSGKDESITEIDVERNRPMFNLHMRQRSTSETVELEMVSMAYRRDVFFDDRIVVTPTSIVYHLADDNRPFKDERYALDKLSEWLAKLEAAPKKKS